MAFDTINSNQIEIGDPVTKELWDKVKGNFDDHETRISQLETVGQKVIVFDFPLLNTIQAGSLTGLTLWRSPFNFTLTEARIVVYDINGNSGTLELDVKKLISPSLNTFSSVFTTKPSVSFPTVANYTQSSNAVFDNALKDIITNDYLRLDITSLPSGILSKCHIYLIGEV